MDDEERRAVGEIRETIEGIQAVNEMLGLFTESGKKLNEIMPLFGKAVKGDAISWITGIAAVGDLDQDEAQGCLIVTLSALCQVLEELPPEQGEQLLKSLKQGKTSKETDAV